MKFIPRVIHELDFEYTRSRGAGGQHVNKTNSAALLRWKVADTTGFDPDEKQRLLTKFSKWLTQEGELVVRSEEFRDQEQNKKKCLAKLDRMIEQALFVPKKRIATKPTKSSQRKRVDEKKRRSQFKRLRGKVAADDD